MSNRCTDIQAPERKYTYLRHLPYDHALRNTLLLDLGAEFKHSAWDEYKPIKAGRPLADNTYNTLSRGWQDFYSWRIPKCSVNTSTS